MVGEHHGQIVGEGVWNVGENIARSQKAAIRKHLIKLLRYQVVLTKLDKVVPLIADPPR